MLTIAVLLAAVLALLTTIAAVIKAALEVDEADKAESLSFVRMALTGIFGIVVGQGITPLGLAWWWNLLIAIALMALLLFGSQAAARTLGHRAFGRFLQKITKRLVNSIHLLFTPLSLPKEDAPEEFEQELLESVEEFGETIVREIMVPRIDMATVASDATLAAAMKVFLARGYSRLPVVGKNIDEIKGVLYLKDVSRLLYENPKQFESTTALQIVRQAIFIPESKPVDDLLREMQLSSTHIAIIIDEYGGVAGLATMEDVIEEIVGEIADEYDKDIPDLEEIEPGLYRVNARYSLFDLGEALELELEDDDVDSVGGLLTKQLGRLPRKADEVVIGGINITADRVEGRRKRLITVLVKRDQDASDVIEALERSDD